MLCWIPFKGANKIHYPPKLFVKKRKFFLLIKNLFLSFTRFSNLILECRSFTVSPTDVCILFSYFCHSFISVSKKRNIETMPTPPYSNNWQNFNNMNEKWSQVYQGIDPEYVTGQINSCILELPLRRFYRLIFALSQKS